MLIAHISGVNVLSELCAEAALLHVVEVDQGEQDEHPGADQAVDTEHHCRAWRTNGLNYPILSDHNEPLP